MSSHFSQQMFDSSVRQAFRLAHRCLTVFNELIPLPGRGAYVAVWHQKDILLIKNGYKSYQTFPCGNIKSSEGAHQAALRELYEEVGISANLRDLDLNMVLPYAEKYDHQIVFIFELHLKKRPKISIDNREVVEALWCSTTQALCGQLCEPVREYLEQKNRSLREVVL